MTEAVKHEMRMPADEFDRIMRHALQAKPPVRQRKASPAKKKTRNSATKRRQK
jgi:hypothetical protein